jgi:2-polyprenyl-6-methoxyphenol hydroxylase-like FAD-dependent oxidoreductase
VTWDVIVAGAGNAGLCAAHAARERGARVLVLEKADEAWSGGNSAFTAGAIRFAHGGLELRHGAAVVLAAAGAVYGRRAGYAAATGSSTFEP